MRKNIINFLSLLLLISMLFTECNAETLNLKEGFNFVAFNVKPSVSPSQVLSQNISIDDIYAYNASAGSFISASEGALTLLNYDKGYIVKTKTSTDVIITGEVMVSNEPAIPIKTGFNLVGISRTPVLSKFSDLLNKYCQIIGMYKWNAASGTFIQVLKNNTGEIELLDGVDPALASGQAYFINASEDFELNYLRYFDTDVANSQSKTADNTGAVFNFDRGVSIEFPAMSSKIDVSEERISDDTSIYIIKSDSSLKNITFKAPLGENMSADDHYLLVAYPQFKFKEYIPGIVEADKCVFKILNNVTVSSPTDNNDIIDPHIKDPSLVKEILFRYTAPDVDLINKTNSLMTSGKKYPVNDIKWPYYEQGAGECWAAAWLMLLKGYKGDLMDDLNTKNFSTLHSLLQQTGISKNEGISIYSILKVVHDKNGTYFRSGLSEIAKKSEELTGKKMEGYGALHPKNIIAKIISKLNNDIPLEIILNGHAFVITGCELSEIVYNPKIYGNNSNKYNPTGNTLPGTEIGVFKDIYNPSNAKVLWTGEHFARFIEVYYSEKPDLRLCKPTACVLYSFNEKPPVSLDAKNLVTINLPTTPADLPEGGSDKPIEDINKSFGAGVGFGIADSNFNVTKTHCWTRWNWFSDTKNPEGYSWVNNGANVDEIPEFNYIIFKKIPAYNMSGNNTKIKVSIYSGNDETKLLSSKFLKDCSGISTYLSNDVYNDTYKTIYENTSQLVKEFKNELKKESNISDNYTIQVAVTDSDGNVILDKFILHFKYRKLVVMPSGGSIYTPGSTVNFIAKVGSEDIMSNKLSWTCESSGNLLSFSEPGKLNIKQGASGIIKVKGIVNDIGSIHYGKEAEFEFSVQAKLNIIPERNPINIFEKTTLTASLGDVPTDASWSIVDATGNVIDYSVNGSCGTLALASNLPAAPKANAAEIRSSKCIYTAPDKPGEYRITATASNGMAELTITVVEPAKGFHIEIDPPVQNATVPEIEYGRHRLVAKIDAVPYDVSGWDVKCLVHNQWHNFGPGRYGYDKSHIVIIPMMPEDSTCRYDEYDVIAHIDATDKQPYREAKIKVKIKDFNPDNGPIDPISNPGNIAEVKVYPDSSIIYNGEKQKLTAVITGVDMSKISNKQWYIEEWYPGANMGTINSNGNECVYTPPDNDLGYNRTIYFKFTLDGKEYKASSAITVSRLKLELNGTSFNIGNGETIKIRASLNDNINVPIMWSNNNTECGSVIAESNGNITTENGYTKIYGVGSYTAKILKSYLGQDIITATAVYQGHTITATANIAVNEIKISVPKKVVALAGKGYINNLNNYVSIEGANNTNLNFMVGTVEIEDGSQYKTDNFSEPYYDDYEKSMLTIISLANGTTMTTEIIIARPVLKEVKQYYDDGRLLLYYKAVVNIDLNNYNNSEFTGTFKEYVMYNHGFYKRYNANGALIEECIYTTGLLNGLYQEYYDNGDLKIKCVYVNNTLNGPYEKYDGEKMTRGRIGEYINNLAENTWTVTSTNGRKWWEGKYVQNLREGKWTNWYDNESHQVQAEVEYANDKKNGTYTEWYDNEKHSIWRQGQYVNDVQTGIWKEWDYNGNPLN